MPDWLSPLAESGVSWQVLVIRLVLAAFFGGLVGAIHRGTRDAARVSQSFPGTLVLLCVLIAMVTQVIGTNVALAFSLVGALSIVRFRTAVQDTRDTAFVIFAVVNGMAIGAGQPAVAVVGTIVVGYTAFLLRDPPAHRTTTRRRLYDLDIRLGWSPEAETLLRQVLVRLDPDAEIVGGGTAKKGAFLSLTYRLRLPRDSQLSAVIAELRGIESVQSVELHQPRREA
jgi:uncharacterized membrane protein YhiD involved in acid resistance